jgi:acetylornithine deacetylase
MFNSHLDSELVPELGGDASAWRDGAWVAGQTVVNDRGTMAAWLIAVRALRDVGVILKGDLLLTAVCGEIGQAPVDEYSGSRYLGEGLGSRALVAAGITADYALVAETTGFGITGTECGSAFLKIHVDGN